ncbi:MAG: hypothetical protein EHM86_05965 [Desulfobulbaceae bacterium]|nr:MAG: hypothetical protein EHM86_05965 [Desulfobulbaceae bacterium]
MLAMDNDNFGTPYSEKDIVISPRRGKHEKQIPASGILLVNPPDAQYAITRLLSEGGELRSIYHTQLCIHSTGRFFIAGPAVSAPIAVMAAEKLIALGARSIYLFSCCGAISPELKIGDIVVGAVPQAGEGTSQYYVCDRPNLPSKNSAERLLTAAQQISQQSRLGNIWTTDAPYRESRYWLNEQLIRNQVVGIDMEYSALCSICNFRAIRFAGIFVISDELWRERWVPGFKNAEFLSVGRKIIHLLLDPKFHEDR